MVLYAFFIRGSLISNKRTCKEGIALKRTSNHELRGFDLFVYTTAYMMWDRKTLVLKCLLLLKETKSLEQPGPGASLQVCSLNFSVDQHFSPIFR